MDLLNADLLNAAGHVCAIVNSFLLILIVWRRWNE